MNVLHTYLHVYFHFSSWIILKIEFVTYVCQKNIFIIFIFMLVYMNLHYFLIVFLQVI